ncbi:telomere-associated RecQ helicase [Metarhizium guizhouense ARSEF 977]|uniref:Telomere-associated RecQ helicase n=1 Tax=Metarhizium guizhouense (strain ARSEF 977) TaxID=1276136 RepID=A0A0B4G595_METGA|nr:telomere-associated RecQ helicase [Metarhizium guizhouense ARSEF 977]
MRERDQDQPFTSLKLWIDYDAAALICCYDRCRCAISVRASRATSHLRHSHGISTDQKKGLTQQLAAFQLRNPDDIPALEDGSPQHPQLRIYEGFACNQCKFRTTSLQIITKRHFSRGPEGYSCSSATAIRKFAARKDDFVESVRLQTWITGPGRKYWIIANDGNAADFVGNQQVNTKEVDHYQSVWMGLKKISTGTSSSPAAPGVHAGDSGSSELGLDSGDEDDCETEQYTTADEEDCADDEEELDDDDDDDDDNGGSSVDCEDDMNVDLSEQHNIIERSAQQTTDVDDKGGHARSDDSVNPYEAILELLFGVCISLCKEHLIDSYPSSMILYFFSGILGFSKSLDAFFPARSFTSHLSALIYIQRLLFLNKRGFSFVTHLENSLAEEYLKLFRRACTADQGKLSSSKGQWNWKAVCAYLAKEKQFSILLASIMYLSGGQVPRWSELLNIWCVNGEFVERSIFVYKSMIIYLIRYHKAKRSANNEFIVACFLPAEASQLVYKYLAVIRPFIDLIGRERNGDQADEISATSPLLFRAQIEYGSKPLDSAQVNAAFRQKIFSVWNEAVNSRTLR